MTPGQNSDLAIDEQLQRQQSEATLATDEPKVATEKITLETSQIVTAIDAHPNDEDETGDDDNSSEGPHDVAWVAQEQAALTVSYDEMDDVPTSLDSLLGSAKDRAGV